MEFSLGFKRVSFVFRDPAGSTNIPPRVVEGRGFGYRIVKGGQYLKRVDAVSGREEVVTVDDSEYGDYFDGKTIAAPGGFQALVFHPVEGIPPFNVRITVDIFTLPSVVPIASSGIEAMGAVQLLPTPIHTDFQSGSSFVTVANGAIDTIHDAPTVGYEDNIRPESAAARRSRTWGDDRFPWWPTPSLFFHGFIASTQPITLHIYAYKLSNTGIPELLPYYVVSTTFLVPAGMSANTLRNMNRVAYLERHDAAVTTQRPLPFPLMGCRIDVSNASGFDADISGIIAART